MPRNFASLQNLLSSFRQFPFFVEIENWSIMQPIPVSNFSFRLVSESPRWLLLNGNDGEAKAVLSKISKMNKRPLPDDLVLKKPVIPEVRISFRQLFSSWKIAKKTLIVWDLWYGFVHYIYTIDLNALNFVFISLQSFYSREKARSAVPCVSPRRGLY